MMKKLILLLALLLPVPAMAQSQVYSVGPYDSVVTDTLTVQGSQQYTVGQCMGGFQVLPVATTVGATGIVDAIALASKGGDTVAKEVYLFNTQPTASTCTDKTTFVLGNADVQKVLFNPLSIAPAVPTGASASFGLIGPIIYNFATASSASGNAALYAAVVATANDTPASNTDIVLILGLIKDSP